MKANRFRASSQTTFLLVSPLMKEDIDDFNVRPLHGCITVVTGASRGIGRGIAVELGKAGATVYITGTTSTSCNRASNSSNFMTNEEVGGPETIEDTARLVQEAGGVAVPFFCDHSRDDDVKALFDRIEKDHGRLDLLVNNAFRLPPGGTKNLTGDFWSQGGVDMWDAVHTVGLRSHYVASCLAIPLMLKAVEEGAKSKMSCPLIVMISSFGGTCYTFNVAYGVGKAGVDRMAKDMALVLREKRIAVNSFYPGVVMTERMALAAQNQNWAKEVGIPLEITESPSYTGKAIVAFATDNQCLSKSGSIKVVAELAKEYGFYDLDGRQPPSIRSLQFLLPAYGLDKKTRRFIPDWLIPDLKIPFFLMASPPEIKN